MLNLDPFSTESFRRIVLAYDRHGAAPKRIAGEFPAIGRDCRRRRRRENCYLCGASRNRVPRFRAVLLPAEPVYGCEHFQVPGLESSGKLHPDLLSGMQDCSRGGILKTRGSTSIHQHLQALRRSLGKHRPHAHSAEIGCCRSARLGSGRGAGRPNRQQGLLDFRGFRRCQLRNRQIVNVLAFFFLRLGLGWIRQILRNIQNPKRFGGNGLENWSRDGAAEPCGAAPRPVHGYQLPR